MTGYKLIDKDWQKIVNDPDLLELICPYCSSLMKEPMASPCGHKFCRGCLFFGESISESKSYSSRNSSVVVCPVDTCRKRFYLQEIVPDEEADEQIKSLHISCTFECDNGKLCEWYGLVRHVEIHWKNYHYNGEASAKELGKTKKAPQHDTQLNPASSPTWLEAPIAGPSGVSLLNSQERPQDDLFISGNSCYDNPTYGDQSLREVAQTLMSQQSLVCNDVAQMKRQLEALGDAVVTRKRDYEQLQDKVQALLSTDHNAIEQLKRQLAVFADELAVEKQNNGRLRDELGTAHGRIQALEQELEAQKNTCASARDECVAERERGIEAQSMESGLLQGYIGNLQTKCAILRERFEDERPSGF